MTARFDHEEARRLRAEGLSLEAVAARIGVSRSTVRRVCPQGAPRARFDHEEARRLYLETKGSDRPWNMTALAAKYGVNRSTIWRAIHGRGKRE